jgi:hypothetical protein
LVIFLDGFPAGKDYNNNKEIRQRLRSPMQADTAEKANTLARLKANPRVSAIRVAAPQDCRKGLSIQGVYDKDGEIPELPVKSCSRPGGCICTYEPVLNTIHP